ncbi:MAG: hypothetical protein QOE70_5740 [Chthoniobacter sp.]|jgi:hypothetical protein|nr:hypothetical protein [Chthoniobacter sp.]
MKTDLAFGGRRAAAELLEPRIAPASIAVGATATYTDASGDVVKVKVTGTAGTADLLDATGSEVVGHAGGADIASIVVKDPSPDFALTFMDTNSAAGGNVITLGRITGDAGARLPLIGGVFTLDGAVYQLGGFVGTNFAAGGGLRILGPLVGDPTTLAVDLDLTTLAKDTTVFLRDGVTASATVDIADNVAGNLTVGGKMAGNISVGAATGALQMKEITGHLNVETNLAGRLIVGDPAHLAPASTGTVKIIGSLLPTAAVTGPGNFRLEVGKDVSGSINVDGSLVLAVTGNLKAANVLVGDNLTLKVDGGIQRSAILAHHQVVAGSKTGKDVLSSSIVGGTGLNLDVTGSVIGSKFSGGSDALSAKITGKVLKSQFIGGSSMDLEVGLGVANSTILPDGDLGLDVGQLPNGGTVPIGTGDLIASRVGSKFASADVTVGGKVAATHFLAGDDYTLQTGRELIASDLFSGGNGDVTIGGFLAASRFVSGSQLKATAGGLVLSSSLIAGNDLTATASAGLAASRLESTDGSVVATIVGSVLTTGFEAGADLTVNVSDLTVALPQGGIKVLKPGSLAPGVLLNAGGDASIVASGKVGARVIAGGDVSIDVDSEFSGSVNAAGDLTLEAPSVKIVGSVAGGTVPASALAGTLGGSNPVPRRGLRAGGDLILLTDGNVLAPLIDVGGNVTDFAVGGTFSAPMFVAGNFLAGTTAASAMVIGGVVAPSAFIQIGGNVGSNDSAPKLMFTKGFGGRLEVLGSLLTDLEFGGSVKSLIFTGGIGAAILGDKIADIIVHGALGLLHSGSLFTSTSANEGKFRNGAGTITGTLLADDGILLIGP